MRFLKALFNRLLEFISPIKLAKEERIDTMGELARFRKLEDQTEQITKLLKCTPSEMLTRVNKIQAHIDEMENTLRNAYVSTLIDKTHKRCKVKENHMTGLAKGCSCEKCLDNECEKCVAVDWLRVDLGLEPLLNKNKCEGEGLTR
jgi:hypothetical protein